MSQWTRRKFLAGSVVGGPILAGMSDPEVSLALESAAAATSPLKVGIVTYNIAKDWDLPTIIKNCTETKYDGVELRTSHAHGVEVSLSPAQRAEVKRRFADSPVKLVQLGSTYEFHSADPAEVQKNIDGCKVYLQLAHDVGAHGVKVRPNGLQTKAGIPVEKTLEQIGLSLRALGKTAADNGVEIRLEVHGTGTSRLEYIQKIMKVADHPQVTVNWNSNPADLEGGTIEENFARVSEKVRHVHTRDLFADYPWRKLFGLLSAMKFQGYCCAEIPESSDPVRIMRYFRALFLAYQGVL
jgi:sugar phosphate isomerase/epimerase